MGRRTSIYLTDALDEGVAAAGLPLAELLRRGLAAQEPGRSVSAAEIREIIREEQSPVLDDLAALRRLIERAAGER
jgi:predicted transcriptional regulator